MRHYYYAAQGGSFMAANLKRSSRVVFGNDLVVTGKDSEGKEIRENKWTQTGVPMKGRKRHAFSWRRPDTFKF